MLNAHRPWLTLLGLAGLTLLVTTARRATAQEAADDLFAIWAAYSSAWQQAQAEIDNVSCGLPWLPSLQGAPRPIAVNAEAPRIQPAVLASGEMTPDSLPQLAGPDAAPGTVWDRPDKTPRKVSQKSEGIWGSVSGNVEVTDLPQTTVWDEPSWKRTWKTDQSYRLPVLGPIAVFGQVGANSDEAGQSNMKVNGRTGLACKVPISLAEITLRSGPGVSYTDPLHPLRTQERSDWLVEVQARWPLLFGIGLEYQGSAMPALTPLAQDLFNQDVRLAFPVGNAGKLKVGARHQWATTNDQRTPWSDTTQLYLGLELAH